MEWMMMMSTNNIITNLHSNYKADQKLLNSSHNEKYKTEAY